MSKEDSAGDKDPACDGKDVSNLTTVNGQTVLLEDAPFSEVITVFADHGLETEVQITEIRNDEKCAEYEPKAVNTAVEFLRHIGVVEGGRTQSDSTSLSSSSNGKDDEEDVDENETVTVKMEDSEHTRNLVTKFTDTVSSSQNRRESAVDLSEPITLVHTQTDTRKTFTSVERCAKMLRGYDEQKVRSNLAVYSNDINISINDLLEYGDDLYEEAEGYWWLIMAMNDPRALLGEDAGLNDN